MIIVANENRCTCCGEVIPEGIMICKMCEIKELQNEMDSAEDRFE